MQAYSMDLHKRVLADSDAGSPTKQVAEKYGVSRTWVRSLKQRRRETGEIAPRVGGGPKPKIDRARLAGLVQQQPDATLMELRERLRIECLLSAIWMALENLRITFKRSAPRRRARPPRRCGEACPLTGVASRARSATARFPGRNAGKHEDDPLAWSRAAWAAGGRLGPARPLGNDHADRRVRSHGRALFDGAGWGGQPRPGKAPGSAPEQPGGPPACPAPVCNSALRW